MTHLALIEGDPNAASRFLNYSSPTLSSRTSPGLLGKVMGPNTFHEVVTVVSVERVLELGPGAWETEDGEAHPVGTRLGFRYGLVPGSKADELAKLTAQQLRGEGDTVSLSELGDRLEAEELYVEDPKGGVELPELETRTRHGRATGPARMRRGVKR